MCFCMYMCGVSRHPVGGCDGHDLNVQRGILKADFDRRGCIS